MFNGVFHLLGEQVGKGCKFNWDWKKYNYVNVFM